MEAALKGDLKAYHTDRHGEQTGCPELRCALAILRFITDEEYAEIMGRPHRERVFTAAGEGI